MKACCLRDLNCCVVSLLNRYSNLPVADDSEVLTAAHNIPDNVPVRHYAKSFESITR